MTAIGYEHTHLVTDILLNSFGNRVIPGCGSFIVTNQCRTAVGIRSDHTDRFNLRLIQRKHMILILQKCDALLGSLEIQLLHRLGIHYLIGNLIIRILPLLIENTQHHAGGKQVNQCFIKTLFLHHSLFHCFL